MVNFLVTGASGFIGQALISRLQNHAAAKRIVAAVRRDVQFAPGVALSRIEDCGPQTNWQKSLAGIDVIVHAAAHVHRMDGDAAPAFHRINTAGTLNLARQAVAAGARRLVFISTVKVNGEATALGQRFRAMDAPAPSDAYALSKCAAEEGLHALAQDSGLEIVIVRPPLVYGPGVGANFLKFMRWIDRGLPLPISRSPSNLRSLIGVHNLADLLVCCALHPAARGKTFLAADGEDVSTEELARRLARLLDKPARMIAVPSFAMDLLPGGSAKRQRLFGSLQVDASPARALLDWAAPLTLDAGLTETVRWYREYHPSQNHGLG
ncbi:MAG: NAD-dependent epimerase/dehydratase family protein [Chromatiales bacterium]|jgi:UDP-glucose 4-epimerase|nr:NAD-dependent epimerase/dehydratase family protein [Chromatiales bacterium]